MTFREELQKALRHEFNQYWGPTPGVLYRYVPAARAQDIRDGKLWASHIRVHSRADLHEFRLGWGIIRATAKSLGDESDDVLTQELCKKIVDDRDPFSSGYDAYVVCLTTQSNAEHMWTTFGPGGVRFGLRTADLSRGLTPAGAENPRLLQVKYEADELIDAVETMIRKVAIPSAQNRLEASPHLHLEAAAGQPFWELRNVFVPMAISFKRAMYRREREWRVVLTRIRQENAEQPPGEYLRSRDATGTLTSLPIESEATQT